MMGNPKGVKRDFNGKRRSELHQGHNQSETARRLVAKPSVSGGGNTASRGRPDSARPGAPALCRFRSMPHNANA